MNTTTNKEGLKSLNVTINESKLYYLTQYASYMTDSGYYSSLKECLTSNFKKEGLKQHDVNDVMFKIELLVSDLMPLVSDSINNKVYDLIFRVKNIYQINNIITFYDNIINNELYEIPGIEDYMLENGIFSPDLYEEFADEDFRANGINASARYWFNKINYKYDYIALNVYMNDFIVYDIEDIILNYINDGYFDFSELLEV